MLAFSIGAVAPYRARRCWASSFCVCRAIHRWKHLVSLAPANRGESGSRGLEQKGAKCGAIEPPRGIHFRCIPFAVIQDRLKPLSMPALWASVHPINHGRIKPIGDIDRDCVVGTDAQRPKGLLVPPDESEQFRRISLNVRAGQLAARPRKEARHDTSARHPLFMERVTGVRYPQTHAVCFKYSHFRL
jgi:hypothetical protein